MPFLKCADNSFKKSNDSINKELRNNKKLSFLPCKIANLGEKETSDGKHKHNRNG